MASVRLPLTLASLLLATPAHAQSMDEWNNVAITQLNRQGAHTLEMPVDEQHAMLRGTWQTDRYFNFNSHAVGEYVYADKVQDATFALEPRLSGVIVNASDALMSVDKATHCLTATWHGMMTTTICDLAGKLLAVKVGHSQVSYHSPTAQVVLVQVTDQSTGMTSAHKLAL